MLVSACLHSAPDMDRRTFIYTGPCRRTRHGYKWGHIATIAGGLTVHPQTAGGRHKVIGFRLLRSRNCSSQSLYASNLARYFVTVGPINDKYASDPAAGRSGRPLTVGSTAHFSPYRATVSRHAEQTELAASGARHALTVCKHST